MQTTAVVLIEYQNDFTSPSGVLHEAVKGEQGIPYTLWFNQKYLICPLLLLLARLPPVHAMAGVMSSTGMLQKTVDIVAAARDKGALIVHAPITFSDDYREMGELVDGILAK